MEYAAPTQALEAVKNADGYKLDKQHTFRVNLFTDFDKYVCRNIKLMHLQMWIPVNSFVFLRYMTISDEWEPPEKQPFKDFVSATLYFLTNASVIASCVCFILPSAFCFSATVSL